MINPDDAARLGYARDGSTLAPQAATLAVLIPVQTWAADERLAHNAFGDLTYRMLDYLGRTPGIRHSWHQPHPETGLAPAAIEIRYTLTPVTVGVRSAGTLEPEQHTVGAESSAGGPVTAGEGRRPLDPGPEVVDPPQPTGDPALPLVGATIGLDPAVVYRAAIVEALEALDDDTMSPVLGAATAAVALRWALDHPDGLITAPEQESMADYANEWQGKA